jgi:hypothetical protein
MSLSYRIKELLQAFDDKAWNRSAALLSHLDVKSLTAKEVLLAVLREDRASYRADTWSSRIRLERNSNLPLGASD